MNQEHADTVPRKIVHPDLFVAHGFEGYDALTCIWDVCTASNGDIFTSLCTEGMPAGLNAHLFRLSAKEQRLIHSVSNRRVTCQDPSTGVMPHSKIHTSMQMAADGKLYYCTYTTSPGLDHEFWDVLQLFDDREQGYEGSHFVVYDTNTDTFESWGPPAPRHLIYGGLLDEERQRYYYLTSMNGRLGYVDLARRRFHDIGRVTRRHTFLMFQDRHGRVFGAQRDGRLWRYDPSGNRVELLGLRLPRREDIDPMQEEVFIISINYLADGRILGACRGGNPLWLYDPEAGPQGRLTSLGLPWHDAPDGAHLTGWHPLLAGDGNLYYWVRTSADEPDLHLVRNNWQTGKRTDLGAGFIAGKGVGAWVGPGACDDHGRLWWGESGYHEPRLIGFDPAKLTDTETPIDAQVPADPQGPVATGAPITEHPVNVAWSETYVDRARLRAIPVCMTSAPYGASALAALAALPNGTVLGLTRGHVCRLIAYEPGRDADVTRAVFDTGVAGTGHAALLVAPDETVWFAVTPADTPTRSILFRGRFGPDGAFTAEPAGHSPQGPVLAMAGDWPRRRLYLLSDQAGLTTLALPTGAVEHITVPIADRQVSPLLILDAEGNLLGAERGGVLWQKRPDHDDIERLPLRLPCQKGRRYLVLWESAARCSDTIYGGTSDGYLFRLTPKNESIVNLGRPVFDAHIRALTALADGRVFGLTGSPQHGFCHLFSYEPATGLDDLGQLDSAATPFGFAVRAGAMCHTADDRIYIGEDDDISHLWEWR